MGMGVAVGVGTLVGSEVTVSAAGVEITEFSVVLGETTVAVGVGFSVTVGVG